MDDVLQCFEVGVALEGTLSCQEIIQDNAERENVTARVDRSSRSLLPGHVGDRPNDHARFRGTRLHGLRRGLERRVLFELGQCEIGERGVAVAACAAASPSATPVSNVTISRQVPNPAVLAVGNVAFSINNHGVIAGLSALSNNTTFHPALWQDWIVGDLGVLPGDMVGAALGLNNWGEVVGASIAAPGPPNGNARAWVWRDGVMNDLNALVPSNSPLFLLTAFAINDSGEIVGFGATESGDIHGFLGVAAMRLTGKTRRADRSSRTTLASSCCGVGFADIRAFLLFS